jgi:hypothetical protein
LPLAIALVEYVYMLLRTVLAISLFICASVMANAATISVLPSKTPSEATIIVEGDLLPTDIDDFRTKISPYSKGMVVLHSRGGSALAGIEIGKIIRFRNFATWVPSGVLCASACAIAWLGGSPRAMGKKALVGFHAAYQIKSGRASETGVGNAVLGSYLGQLGLPDRAIIYLTKSGPNSMTWLTPKDARALGIDVAIFDPDHAVAKKLAPARPSLEVLTLQFLKEQYEHLSGSNFGMKTWAKSVYASQARYFGEVKTRQEIVAEIMMWLERWPKRTYRPRDKSIEIQCNHDALLCTAKGLLDFLAQSYARNEQSEGVATFEFTLSFANPHSKPRIVAEGGRTLQRHKQPIIRSGAMGRMRR